MMLKVYQEKLIIVPLVKIIHIKTVVYFIFIIKMITMMIQKISY